jgi:subtilisin family serine protease
MRERAIELARLDGLMQRTAGRADVRVGLVDGMVNSSHPLLTDARIESTVPGRPSCDLRSGVGCAHGSFLAGLLVGQGGICPGVTLVSRPVFRDAAPAPSVPSATPDTVAEAIFGLVEAGASAINVSAGIASGGLRRFPALDDACDFARDRGVAIVAASGNQGRVGATALFGHEWVIPVASCLENGAADFRSNVGPTVGRRGLRAPGFGIAWGGIEMRGTSVAAVFVTGTLALLRSMLPGRTAYQLRSALLLEPRRSVTVTPPLLDAAASFERLMRSAA